MYKTIKKLYFEPSSRCNLNCVMCFRHTWINEGFGDLDLADFYRVIDDKEALKNCHTVFFGGMGEPLVHANIVEMISAVNQRGMEAQMLTNGTLLTKQLIYELIKAGLSKLWISIDSFEDDCYSSIQVGSQLTLIKRNLLMVKDAIAATGSNLKLCMTVVLMRSNIGQLAHIKNFVESIGIDELNFSHMIPNTVEGESESLYQVTETANVFNTFCDCVEQSYTNPCDNSDASCDCHGLKFQIEDPTIEELARFEFLPRDFKLITGLEDCRHLLNNKRQLVWDGKLITRKQNYCPFVEEGNCFVRWDGNVVPCMALLHSAKTCVLYDERTVWHYSFGNVKEDSLANIWNKDEFKLFRENVHSFDFSPCLSCGGCTLREENLSDCTGHVAPTCGACLWAQGYMRCP